MLSLIGQFHISCDKMKQNEDSGSPRTSRTKTALAIALSKLGISSRNHGRELILEGKISVNGLIQSDPHFFVDLLHDIIKIEG